VENSLDTSGAKFVANDCALDKISSIAILTGPNMGGKSTFLRQNAIIVIMAQIGSFVPADEAIIGIVDRVYSRVGASDDIATGRSTFMIEMLETATILQQATENSFIILDEIGRGTSTYDGLAIAWAVIEEIALKIKARTLFATHYHELKKINETITNAKFITVKIEEWNENIIFLHKIISGFADKSYGLNVASIAGFPQNVLDRAAEVLKSVAYLHTKRTN
jgi:DNA mismatch repair protein MutS